MAGERLAPIGRAFVAALRDEGIEPDPALELVSAGTAAPGGHPDLDGPDDLGPALEALLDDDERTRRGAWYTPRVLAEALTAMAVPALPPEPGSVLDSSCGGGAFLLAAVRRLVDLGASPVDAVRGVRGIDLDPDAVAVSRAALWWWAARAAHEAHPRRAATTGAAGTSALEGLAAHVRESIVVGDGLTTEVAGSVVAVVGNPPFLGQLRATTSHGPERRARLVERFGSVLRPYTDVAWLFLLDAVERLAPGARCVLIQPQSILAARDAGAVRDQIGERAVLESVWLPDGRHFDAAVDICAPVLVRAPVTPMVDPADDAERAERAERVGRAERAGRARWTAAVARSRGIPPVELAGRSSLGAVAALGAGFRDEYYGLVSAISEGGAGRCVVTCGAIDPFAVRSGFRQRLAGERYLDPRVDLDQLSGRAAAWARQQDGPKILVATQTRVIEAVADPGGELVGSTPVIVVRPHDQARLWHLLALVHAPAVTARVLAETAGTAMSRDACKPNVRVLGELPLPVDDVAWDAAAAAARELSAGRGDLERFAALADRALGVDDLALRSWWLERLPQRGR